MKKATQQNFTTLNAKASFIQNIYNGGLSTIMKDPKGHAYYKKKTNNNGQILWYCRMFKPQPHGTKCRAKAITDGSTLQHVKNHHNHPASYNNKYNSKEDKRNDTVVDDWDSL